MSTGLDLAATLHRIVRDATGSVPGAQRGSLLIEDGDRLVYRAAVGFDGLLGAPLRVPSDAGPADAGPADALPPPDPREGPRVVAAAEWYRARLPDAAALSRLPAGAAVVLAPVSLHGRPIGALAVEQPAAAPLPDGRWALLQALAASASAALERRELYDDKARSAHENRVLEEVLNAVAVHASPHQLVEIISSGIKSIQLRPQWSAVELVLLEDPGRGGSPASEPWAGREARVYQVPRRAPTSYWNSIRDGALAAGRNLGVDLTFCFGGIDGEGSQVALLEEGIRRGVHGIAVAPSDAPRIEPMIRRAREAGIPVITFDAPPVEGSGALAYVGTDNVAAGRLAGEMMARLLPDGGAVGAQLASLRAANGPERVAGFGAAVAGTAIALQPASENMYDTSRALELAMEALRTGELAGAFGACAENGPAWGMAARAMGRAGDLKIVAFDLVPETIAMLREGTVHATVVQREYDMGYRTVQVLHDMVSRGVEATLAELPAPRPGEAPRSARLIDTGADVVTLERTPWSRPLSEHLALETTRKTANRRRGQARAARPFELLAIGVDVGEEGFVEKSARVEPGSLVGRVLSVGRSIVVDTLDERASDEAAGELRGMPDVAEARRRGALTLVGVPLLARGVALGVLVLSSERRAACSAEDLTQIERITDTLAVALENGQLVRRITERTQELEEANERQAALLGTIQELSSPVVPIARNILVMPIIGTMDAQRTGRFLESMLREISERRARVVLIDVTGMAVVDAVAADHLMAAARAARLLGAEVVLVGITPAAAQLMVEQGLDLGGVVTRSTLELGFAYALSQTGGRVVYGRSRRARRS
ncbi:substrate-binding domain-containing protein [Sorangium sp. So ce513]|uniref:substrate-binding domain-containing protein n=1 Tax=Sorangium sp. So ce513 TaxID=3133315 RepID=UPI003F62F31E